MSSFFHIDNVLHKMRVRTLMYLIAVQDGINTQGGTFSKLNERTGWNNRTGLKSIIDFAQKLHF